MRIPDITIETAATVRAQELAQDWERKRADAQAPGAPPDPGEMGARERGEPVKEPSGESEEESSPGPEAPPQGAEPSQAEAAAEGAAGPPADTDDTSHEPSGESDVEDSA